MNEYPKMLYRGTEDVPETRIVKSLEEEATALEDGWATAATFYGYDGATPSQEEPKKRGKR